MDDKNNRVDTKIWEKIKVETIESAEMNWMNTERHQHEEERHKTEIIGLNMLGLLSSSGTFL